MWFTLLFSSTILYFERSLLRSRISSDKCWECLRQASTWFNKTLGRTRSAPHCSILSPWSLNCFLTYPRLSFMYLVCWEMLATRHVAVGVSSIRPSLLWSDFSPGRDDLLHSATWRSLLNKNLDWIRRRRRRTTSFIYIRCIKKFIGTQPTWQFISFWQSPTLRRSRLLKSDSLRRRKVVRSMLLFLHVSMRWDRSALLSSVSRSVIWSTLVSWWSWRRLPFSSLKVSMISWRLTLPALAAMSAADWPSLLYLSGSAPLLSNCLATSPWPLSTLSISAVHLTKKSGMIFILLLGFHFALLASLGRRHSKQSHNRLF